MRSVIPWSLVVVLLLAEAILPEGLVPGWTLHAGCVALLLLAAVPRLWRAPTLRWGAPALLTGLALLSLTLALVLARPEAPAAELRWAAFTGALHAAFFLLALAWLPGPEADAACVRRTALLLCGLLLSMCCAQAVRGLLAGQWGGPEARMAGTLGSPNAFGSLVAATVLTVLGTGLALRGAAPAAGRRPLLAALLLTAPLLPALLASRSRGAVAALLVTLVVLAARWRRVALLAAVAVAVLLVLVVPNPLRERLANLQPDHAFTRPFLWGTAAALAAEHPSGLGPAMFKYEFPARAWDEERPWLVHQRHSVGLAHNVFLTLTAEWGWLAGAALLLLAISSARRVLATPGGANDPLRLGATLGALVLLLELQVDGIEQNPPVFTVFLLLAAAALARLPRPAGRDVPGRAVAMLCLLAGLVAGGLCAWRQLGQVALLHAEKLAAGFTAADDPRPVRAAFTAAAAALPGELAPLRSRLEFEDRALAGLWAEGATADDPEIHAAIAEARAAGEAAVAANGLDPDLRSQVTSLVLRLWRRLRQPELLGQYVVAARAGLRLDPLDVEGHFELAQEARRSGLASLSEQEFEEVFRIEPDHALAWLVRARLLEQAGEMERTLYALVRTEESILNDQLKLAVDNARSREFYERLLRQADVTAVRERIADLRRELYF